MIRVSINEKDCLACGSCLSADHIIRERSDGKAETIPGICIASADLDTVQQVQSLCPIGAISYEEVKEDAFTDEKAKEMVDTFIERLRSIVLPKPKYCDLIYVGKNYGIDCPDLHRVDKYYSSFSKALNALMEDFNRSVYKNHRAFLLDLATQYRVATAHEYESYGPTSYYGRWNERIGRELKNFYDELVIATKGRLPLPPSFEKFNAFVDLPPKRVEKQRISKSVEKMATKAWSAMEEESYYSLDSYKCYVEVDVSELVVDGVLGTATTKEYRVNKDYEIVNAFIEDLEQAMCMLGPQDDMEWAIIQTLKAYCSEVNTCLCEKISLLVQALSDYGIGPVFDDFDSYRLSAKTMKFVTVEK